MITADAANQIRQGQIRQGQIRKARQTVSVTSPPECVLKAPPSAGGLAFAQRRVGRAGQPSTVRFSVVGATSRTIAFPAVHVQFASSTVHRSVLLRTVQHLRIRSLER